MDDSDLAGPILFFLLFGTFLLLVSLINMSSSDRQVSLIRTSRESYTLATFTGSLR